MIVLRLRRWDGQLSIGDRLEWWPGAQSAAVGALLACRLLIEVGGHNEEAISDGQLPNRGVLGDGLAVKLEN